MRWDTNVCLLSSQALCVAEGKKKDIPKGRKKATKGALFNSHAFASCVDLIAPLVPPHSPALPPVMEDLLVSRRIARTLPLSEQGCEL